MAKESDETEATPPGRGKAQTGPGVEPSADGEKEAPNAPAAKTKENKPAPCKPESAKPENPRPDAAAPKAAAAQATVSQATVSQATGSQPAAKQVRPTGANTAKPGSEEPDRDLVADTAALAKDREQIRELSSSYAQKSLDRMIWLNAAAIGALLPIGELLGATFADPIVVAYFLLAGAFFGLGILLSIVATIFGYFSMDRYRKAIGHRIRFNSAGRTEAEKLRDQGAYRKFRDKGSRSTGLSVWLTLLSGILFILGAATLFCWKLGFEVMPVSWIALLAR